MRISTRSSAFPTSLPFRAPTNHLACPTGNEHRLPAVSLSAAWPRPRAKRACSPIPLRPSGFSRQPPSGGLNLAIKAHCLAGARLADGLSGGPSQRRGVACVASAGSSGGSGGGGGGSATAWVTTPRASPTSVKLVESVGKLKCCPAEGGRAGRLHIPAHMGPSGGPGIAPSPQVSSPPTWPFLLPQCS